MKTLLQVLLLMCVVHYTNAQIVNIPDPVFKQALLDHSPEIDTNQDGEIQVSEAEALTGLLDVNGQFIDIHDLTGIEAFVNITELQVWQNQLTELDLSQNTLLERIECFDNPLIILNISDCVLLKYLHSDNTQLNSLNLTDHSNLIEIIVSNNQLIDLDIRNGNNVNITAFTSYGNPNLTCIFVDDAVYSQANWPFIDQASTFVETQEECDALGFNDFFIQEIKIYPNPVQNRLNVQLPEHSYQDLSFKIVDILGKEVYYSAIDQLHFPVETFNFQRGVYFLSIYNNKTKLLTKKLIKR